MGKTTWSQADELMLGSLWRSGYTGGMIADYFGITRSKALGKLNRLGLLGKIDEQELSTRVSKGMYRSHASGTRKPKNKWRKAA